LEIPLSIEISDALTKMDESQLLQLHKMIGERLKIFQKAKALKAMKDFNIGDTVFFNHYGEEIIGRIKRLNQKSVTLKANDGRDWNVSPQLLKKFIDI
jgi:hypothetical protein